MVRGQENEVPNEGKKATFSVFEDASVPPPVPELPEQAPQPQMACMEVEDKENQNQPVLHDALIGLNPHVPARHIVMEPVHVDLEDVTCK